MQRIHNAPAEPPVVMPIDADTAMRALKADRELSGMTVSCPSRWPQRKSVFHVHVDADTAGNVKVSGQVPSPELSSYIEARIGLLKGVTSVRNHLKSVLAKRCCDVEQVLTKLIENDPELPNEALKHIEVRAAKRYNYPFTTNPFTTKHLE